MSVKVTELSITQNKVIAINCSTEYIVNIVAVQIYILGIRLLCLMSPNEMGGHYVWSTASQSWV